LIVASLFDGIWSGIEGALISALNAIIAAIAFVLSALISALPSMPSIPTLPTPFSTAESWVAWVWPVQTTIDALAFVLSMYLIWFVISIVLRWAKVASNRSG
jgi:hypothetical protein